MLKRSKITIMNYKLWIYIGVTKQERKHKQEVELLLEINFADLPKATITDNIKDTLCYQGLCEQLEIFNSKSFSTVEYCGMKIYNVLHKIIAPNTYSLELKKKPPIKNLFGGIKFTINNFKI